MISHETNYITSTTTSVHVDYLIIENPFIEKKNLICQKLTIVSVHVDYLIIENLFIEFFFFFICQKLKEVQLYQKQSFKNCKQTNKK